MATSLKVVIDLDLLEVLMNTATFHLLITADSSYADLADYEREVTEEQYNKIQELYRTLDTGETS